MGCIALIAYAIKLYFNILLARHVRPGLYGDFNVALKSAMVVGGLILLGTQTSAKRFLARYIREKNFTSASEFLRWNARVYFFISAAIFFLLCIVAIVIVTLHLNDVRSFNKYSMYIYFLWFAPFIALSNMIIGFMMCNENIFAASIYEKAMLYLIGIVFLLIATYGFDIIFDNFNLWLIGLYTFLILLFCEIIFLLFGRNRRRLFANVFLLFKAKRGKISDRGLWWKTSIHLMLNNIVFLIVTVIDLYIVKIFAPHRSDLDHYAAMIVIASLLWSVSFICYNFIIPRVSYLFEVERNMQETQSIINRTNCVCFLICAIIFVLFVVFCKPILSIFGDHYPGAYIPFIVLTVGYYIGTFSKPAVPLIAYTGNELWFLGVSILEFIILLAVGIPLTIFYGIIGAAIGSTVAIVVKVTLLIIIAHWKTGIRAITIF